MAKSGIEQFRQEREALNELVFRYAGKGMKRFFALDHQTYQSGVLPAKLKEMMGLVASTVLRCDDCIRYHLIRCHEEGMTSAELDEVLTIALIVGGSITIPHVRRAVRAWADLQTAGKRKGTGNRI
jgi:AhpD family alkylhydroperoxidase